MTFCRFPPDSVPIGSSGRALIVKLSIRDSACSRRRRLSSSSPRRNSERCSSARLWATLSSPTTAACRSSGIRPSTGGDDLRGHGARDVGRRRPRRCRRRPGASRRARRRARSARCRRRPRRRGSRPARTSKRDVASAPGRPAVATARDPRPAGPARRAGAPGVAARRSVGRPTISAASSRSSISAVTRVPTTTPRRSTVTRSAISRTSFSLWLMKMIDMPSAAQAPQRGEQLVHLLRREHGRRLVEDQDAASR